MTETPNGYKVKSLNDNIQIKLKPYGKEVIAQFIVDYIKEFPYSPAIPYIDWLNGGNNWLTVQFHEVLYIFGKVGYNSQDLAFEWADND